MLNDDGRIALEGINRGPIAFSALTISPRLGNTRRYVEFPNGAHFETVDNDSIDRLIALKSGDRTHNLVLNLVYKMESSKSWVMTTLLIVVLFGWGFIQYGIPFFSNEIALMVSDKQARMLGDGALDSLDDHIMQASELSESRQQELQNELSVLLSTLKLNNIRIVFRKSDIIGANALALPDGTLIFTDGLIELADDNNEIISVMLHEIGHVQYRHSLRRIIQDLSLAVFVAVISGDISAGSSIITGLPALLVESGYSRDMETEADTFALDHMLQHDINPAYFSTLMQKLQMSGSAIFLRCIEESKVNKQDCLKKVTANTDEKPNEAKRKTKVEEEKKAKKKGILRYFASHPLTEERVARFRQAASSGSDSPPLVLPNALPKVRPKVLP